MGCDIHATLEYDKWYEKLREKSEEVNHDFWAFAKDIDIDRSYYLFTVLAGVRDTGVRPIISVPRGAPNNASYEFLEELEEWDGDAHSTSFVTFKELEEWKPEDEKDGYDFREDDWYKTMELLANKYGNTNVRLCFFFDN